MKKTDMTIEKFVNIQRSLVDTCAAEERRTPGARCGFVFLLAEMAPGSNEIRVRSSSVMPTEFALQVLEMALLDLRTRSMKSDAAAPVPEPAPPNLTCHQCRRQHSHDHVGNCEFCEAPAEEIYL